MASEPVLSSEVGNRTSRVDQPVMVISAMAAVVWCVVVGQQGSGMGRKDMGTNNSEASLLLPF
jgi:hypothetical protein